MKHQVTMPLRLENGKFWRGDVEVPPERGNPEGSPQPKTKIIIFPGLQHETKSKRLSNNGRLHRLDIRTIPSRVDDYSRRDSFT